MELLLGHLSSGEIHVIGNFDTEFGILSVKVASVVYFYAGLTNVFIQ